MEFLKTTSSSESPRVKGEPEGTCEFEPVKIEPSDEIAVKLEKSDCEPYFQMEMPDDFDD